MLFLVATFCILNTTSIYLIDTMTMDGILMDSNSKKVVDISLARVLSGQISQQARMVKVKQALFLVGVCCLVFWAYFAYDPNVTIPSLNAQVPETQYLEGGVIQVSIDQGALGHYQFLGEINGMPVEFMLDTGASYVSVPMGVANFLKLPLGEPFDINTANGRSTAYSTKVNTISVGGITLNDVATGVASGMEGTEILLGMSFLKDLDVVQSGGKITITQQ